MVFFVKIIDNQFTNRIGYYFQKISLELSTIKYLCFHIYLGIWKNKVNSEESAKLLVFLSSVFCSKVVELNKIKPCIWNTDTDRSVWANNDNYYFPRFKIVSLR